MIATVSANTYVSAGSALVAGVGAFLLLFLGDARPVMGFSALSEWDRQLVTWEHDRLTGLAKGLGTAGAGFFTSLLVASFKGEIDAAVTPWQIAGCFLGIIGCLIAATELGLQARDLVRSHPRPHSYQL